MATKINLHNHPPTFSAIARQINEEGSNRHHVRLSGDGRTLYVRPNSGGIKNFLTGIKDLFVGADRRQRGFEAVRGAIEREYSAEVAQKALASLNLNGEIRASDIERLQKALLRINLGEDPVPTAKTAEVKSTASVAMPGGIQNGGNTCYLASAMQAINSVKEYKNLFDPGLTRLAKRPNETDASYGKRQAIQRQGSAILAKIGNGTVVGRDEINAFRRACYDYSDGKQRVVNDLGAEEDAMATLGRLLSAMDYEEQPLRFEYQDMVDGVNFEVLEDQSRINEYSTLEQVENYHHEGTLNLEAYNYIGAEVSMSALLQESWKSETISDYKVRQFDAQSGKEVVVMYKTADRMKNLDLKNSNWPNVLRVTVTQWDGLRKAQISHPETIYPSGTDGVGPRYRLSAVIEHQPNHYICHVMQADGKIITANDSYVSQKKSSTIPGFGYIYVRDLDRVEN